MTLALMSDSLGLPGLPPNSSSSSFSSSSSTAPSSSAAKAAKAAAVNANAAADAPWPAVRVAVTGTALDPKIGWLGATRDAAALLLPGGRVRRRRGAGSGAQGFPAVGGSGRRSNNGNGNRDEFFNKSSSSSFSQGPFFSQATPQPLPWENHLQRSGGSRREETAGAPLGPIVVGRLERSGARGKFSVARRSG